MATLGQDLKKERELRGISLKEIADTTKINIRYLQTLEEDQIDVLPGSFFIKGILRSYSEYVGLDEHDVLNRFYQEEQRKQQVQEEEEDGQEEEEGNKKGLSRTVRSLLSFSAVVIILVGILVVLYFIFQQGGNPTLSEQVYTTKIPEPLRTKDNKIKRFLLILEIPSITTPISSGRGEAIIIAPKKGRKNLNNSFLKIT